MSEFVVVFVTAGSADEGDRLARALVEGRLAACVNRVKPVQSIYRWQGKIESSEEELLIVKTRRDLFERLKEKILELHSYSVPEIIALPILAGSESYLRWLEEELFQP
ncbi:MAG TPA: divalent-cation tolerance protein CutA [Candidatus Binatia bacterium]|jgi:periplasmic divalent cation tolerance protein